MKRSRATLSARSTLHWGNKGCPEEDQWALIDAALGALEGALGDWAAVPVLVLQQVVDHD